jgi:hypothetical protein
VYATNQANTEVKKISYPSPFAAQVVDFSEGIDIETIVSSTGFSTAVTNAIVAEVGEDIGMTIDNKLEAFASSDALSGAIAGAFDTDAVKTSVKATIDKHLTRKRKIPFWPRTRAPVQNSVVPPAYVWQ